VQWHPEALPGDAVSRRLYAQFVAACTTRQISGVPGCASLG
jgi:carbamoylphosphate synthase small subunit